MGAWQGVGLKWRKWGGGKVQSQLAEGRKRYRVKSHFQSFQPG